MDPDVPLLDRILAGEQQAYAILVNKHKGYAYTIAVKVLLNRPEAEEAAQDSFIKAFNHLKTFNRQSKFSTWLYRIVFNTAISYKRKSRINFYNIEKAKTLHNHDEEGALEKDDKERYIQQAMLKLTESDRTALTLFYLQEFSLEEIAEITNQPANTIKVRIHRARQRLADELKTILNGEALML